MELTNEQVQAMMLLRIQLYAAVQHSSMKIRQETWRLIDELISLRDAFPVDENDSAKE